MRSTWTVWVWCHLVPVFNRWKIIWSHLCLDAINVCWCHILYCRIAHVFFVLHVTFLVLSTDCLFVVYRLKRRAFNFPMMSARTTTARCIWNLDPQRLTLIMPSLVILRFSASDDKIRPVSSRTTRHFVDRHIGVNCISACHPTSCTVFPLFCVVYVTGNWWFPVM